MSEDISVDVEKNEQPAPPISGVPEGGELDQPLVEGELNENPDDHAGEEVEPEHDLDISSFDDEED